MDEGQSKCSKSSRLVRFVGPNPRTPPESVGYSARFQGTLRAIGLIQVGRGVSPPNMRSALSRTRAVGRVLHFIKKPRQ